MTLFSRFSEKIFQHFPKPQAFLIGLSGGMDSVVLLHLFHHFCQQHPAYSFRALHVHHGISPFAEDWLNFCEVTCKSLGVPFLSEKVQLEKAGNLEANARSARYQAVENYLKDNEIFVTAHHQDDQVETFFLALKRGSGLQGLSAMATQSTLGKIKIFRPLLNFSRQDLQLFAEDQKLSWVEDESNQDQKYDRNFLRHQGLKDLRARWQHFDQSVVRTAMLCQEQQALIEEMLCPDFRKNFHPFEQSFDVSYFEHYSEAKQNALLRMWLQALNHPMPSVKQLQRLKKEVIFAQKDATPQFQYSGKVIRRYQQKLYLTPIFEDLKGFIFSLKPRQKMTLPDGLGEIFLEESGKVSWKSEQKTVFFHLPETEKVEVRFHYSGKVKRANGQHETMKKCWQTHQIPPWQRNRIPLIFIEEKFICALGYFSSLD